MTARLPGMTWLSLVCAAGLVLVSCDETPTDIGTMAADLETRLAAPAAADAAAPDVVVDLASGFGAALAGAVLAQDSYAAATAAEAAVTAQVRVAQSVRRPQASGNLNMGGVRETGGAGADETTTGAAATITASQLIYDGGESTAAVNRATAEALAARADREVLGNELALGAATAWIDLWQYGERIALLRGRAAELDDMIVQMERMAANGFVDRAAVESARRQIVEIALEETRLDLDLSEARVRFAQFFGQVPASVAQPPDLLSEADLGAAVTGWRDAPSLRRTGAQVLVAETEVAIAAAAYRPRVRMQAGLGSPMDEDDPFSASAGIMVDMVLVDGDRRAAAVDGASAGLAAAEATLDDALRAMDARLAVALDRLAAVEASMPLVAEQIRLSAAEAETARAQIATGQSTIRQLVDAEVEAYRAEDRLIAMRAERQMLLLTIAAETGVLGRRIGLSLGETAVEGAAE